MRDTEFMSEGEFELENQAEPFLGGLLGGLLGEGEEEDESWESLGESGLGELEDESGFGESSLEGFGDGEEFLGRLGKALKKGAGFVINQALPVARKLAPIIAPMIQKAVAGPLGGVLSNIGKYAGQVGNIANQVSGAAGQVGDISSILLGGGGGVREGEWEYEAEAELEAVMEGPLTEQQALGELMAAAAAEAASHLEAEAQIGASVVISLTPQERDILRAVLPSINRGAAVLTRILRRSRASAPIVRTVPVIVKRTAVTLRKQAAAGRPVTKAMAGKAMAAQTQRVLSSPHVCGRALQRNVKATRAIGNRIRTTQRQAYAD